MSNEKGEISFVGPGGRQVILDRDLAMLYGVPTKALNQAVKRNAEHFPDRFMFRLSESEMGELVANCDRFGRMKHSSVETVMVVRHADKHWMESLSTVSPLWC